MKSYGRPTSVQLPPVKRERADDGAVPVPDYTQQLTHMTNALQAVVRERWPLPEPQRLELDLFERWVANFADGLCFVDRDKHTFIVVADPIHDWHDDSEGPDRLPTSATTFVHYPDNKLVFVRPSQWEMLRNVNISVLRYYLRDRVLLQGADWTEVKIHQVGRDIGTTNEIRLTLDMEWRPTMAYLNGHPAQWQAECCRPAAIAMLALGRQRRARFARDVAYLLARAVWETRVREEWRIKVGSW